MGVEINKHSDIVGVVTTAAIAEGRMVLLTSHSESYDFGSRTELPGVKLPADSTEAGQAKYCLAFAVDNRETPIYQPTPSFSFALRQGFDQAANSPFSATVYLTHPGNMVGQTVPSGVPALALAGGTYTVPSGAYVYNASLTSPGARLTVANTSDDTAAESGKLKYDASGTIAIVERYDSSTGSLTFRTLVP